MEPFILLAYQIKTVCNNHQFEIQNVAIDQISLKINCLVIFKETRPVLLMPGKER